jgi:hypothetical protein
VTVYVDKARNPYRRMLMSHMLADSINELHGMADKIGLSRRHFQPLSSPHYDVCQAYRAKAIAAGAVEISRQELGALIKRLRADQLKAVGVK